MSAWDRFFREVAYGGHTRPVPVARHVGLVITDSGDGLLVYDQARHHIHHLDPLSALVFRHLDGRRTLADLVALAQSALGPGATDESIRMALRQLADADLLVSPLPPDMAPTSGALSRRRFLTRAAAAGGVVIPSIVSVTAPTTYLITICTEQRLCLFGTVADGEMVPSPAGVVIDSWWHYLPVRIASVELDAAIVMPNHFHAVVHLGTDPNLERAPALGEVIRWFKRRTTYDYTVGVRTEGWARFPGRLWQQSYYDRIIRDERALERAREYVIDNPAKWADDEYHQS